MTAEPASPLLAGLPTQLPARPSASLKTAFFFLACFFYSPVHFSFLTAMFLTLIIRPFSNSSTDLSPESLRDPVCSSSAADPSDTGRKNQSAVS
jgi:hypothetical protein